LKIESFPGELVLGPALGSAASRTCSVPVIANFELANDLPTPLQTPITRPSLEPSRSLGPSEFQQKLARTRSEGARRGSMSRFGRRSSMDGMLPEERLKALGGEAERREVPRARKPSLGPPQRSMAQATRAQSPRVDAPRAQSPRAQAPRAQSPRAHTPRAQSPCVEATARARPMPTSRAHVPAEKTSQWQRPTPSSVEESKTSWGARSKSQRAPDQPRHQMATQQASKADRPATARARSQPRQTPRIWSAGADAAGNGADAKRAATARTRPKPAQPTSRWRF